MKTSMCVHLLAVLGLCACPLPVVVGDSPLEGSSGEPGSTGSAEPTTTGAMEATTSGELSTTAGATTSGETTSAGETTGGVSGSTGGTSGDATGAGSTGGDGGSTGGSDTLELDPRTMQFFNLPINSIRYAAAGHDAAHGLCVAIIWYNPLPGEHCDIDPMSFSPYVHVEPGAPPCTDWDYGPNVELTGASGCYEWVSFEPPAATLDLTLEVVGEAFTGTITAKTK